MRNKAPRKKLCASQRVDIPPLHDMIVQDSRCFQGWFFFKDFQKINPVGRIFNLKPPLRRFFSVESEVSARTLTQNITCFFVLNKKNLQKHHHRMHPDALFFLWCFFLHQWLAYLALCSVSLAYLLYHMAGMGLLPNSSGDWSRPRSWSRNSEWHSFWRSPIVRQG